jgi:formylglycine-generating enzyme required for sulfatase activity
LRSESARLGARKNQPSTRKGAHMEIFMPRTDPVTGECYYAGKWYSTYAEAKEAYIEYEEARSEWECAEYDRMKDEK